MNNKIMNKQQRLHVGMINSYNLITGSITIDEIVNSGVSVFAHTPDSDIRFKDINLMLLYFKDLEMYEYCTKLIEYINTNFNEDGTEKEDQCECDYPNLLFYTKKTKCSNCNKRLKL